MHSSRLFSRQRSRGAASLLIVAVLLAVMAVGVVFTNRNLIIEQKISANQYRSTIAAEAAEAGLEWAAAMLNQSSSINTACAVDTTQPDSFREKYFTLNTTTGVMTPRATTPNANGVHVACVARADGTAGWSCSCPAVGTAPAPADGAPAAGFQPSFAIRFLPATLAGSTRIEAWGCTSRIVDQNCTGDASAYASVQVAGVPALATPPAAPLTARGSVQIGNAALGVANGDPTTNGVTINSGLGIDATNVRISTVPGTPPRTTLVGNDPSLRDTSEDQMFATFFGMTKDSFKKLPAVEKVTCPCTETTLTDLAARDKTILWLEGDLVMNANVTIGSPDAPLLVVVNGSVTMRGDIEFYGLIYSTAITWDNTGGGSALLTGAAVSEGNYTGNGTPDYVYDAKVLQGLRFRSYSFLRVPGSWRDFQD